MTTASACNAGAVLNRFACVSHSLFLTASHYAIGPHSPLSDEKQTLVKMKRAAKASQRVTEPEQGPSLPAAPSTSIPGDAI